MDITTTVTPSLHPSNIEAIEGYNADTKGYVNPALEAMSVAYEGLAKIHQAKVAAAKNQAWNENQQVLIVAEFAEKHQNAITRKFDAALSSLTKGIEAMEATLNDPIKANAERSSIASEIRAHVKNMTTDERLQFLSHAHETGDIESLRAVLGAPGFLSGISENERQVRTRMLHEKQSPETSSRLKVMRAALDLLERRSGLVLTEVEKAVGGSWSKVQHLRATQGQAEKALKFG